MTRNNIALFARQNGRRTGVLTVTFADQIDSREAQRRLGNFKRGVLKAHFGENVTVREFTKGGRPHFHLVIDCRGDITTGFNWEYHDAVTAWTKAGRLTAKPVGALNCTELLHELHHLLRKKGPVYGMGRMELVPVRDPEAIGFYLGGYLSKSVNHKPPEAKRSRPVNYSQGAPRAMKGKFSWATAGGWLYRKKLEVWAHKHGCEDLAALRSKFGPHWAHTFKDEIWNVQLLDYPSTSHAAADGVLMISAGASLQDVFNEARRLPVGNYELRESSFDGTPSNARSSVPPESRELRGADGEAPCSTALNSQAVAAVRNYALKPHRTRTWSAHESRLDSDQKRGYWF